MTLEEKGIALFNASIVFFLSPFTSLTSLSFPTCFSHSSALTLRIYSVLNSLGLYNKNAKILFLVREKTVFLFSFFFSRSIAAGLNKGGDEQRSSAFSRASLSPCYPFLSSPCICESRGGFLLDSRARKEAKRKKRRERERESEAHKKEEEEARETERPTTRERKKNAVRSRRRARRASFFVSTSTSTSTSSPPNASHTPPS